MMEKYYLQPIGYVENDFKEKFGIPRQSGIAPLLSRIVLEDDFAVESAFFGLDGFSHLWLIFGFSKVPAKTKFSPTVRPPRLGGNTRVGVFASRSPFRPNRLGLSCVRFLGLKRDENGKLNILVEGADLLDKTPIFDVKPYLPYADCVPSAIGGYADGLTGEKLQVVFPETELQKIPKDKREGLLACLKDDPRPSYQEDGRTYKMRFWEVDVAFRVEDGVLTVQAVDKVRK